MWVARDKNGVLKLFVCKPTRINNTWYFDANFLILFGQIADKFNMLKWEDEPIEVDVINCETEQQCIDFKKATDWLKQELSKLAMNDIKDNFLDNEFKVVLESDIPIWIENFRKAMLEQ